MNPYRIDFGWLDPDPHSQCGSESGSRRAKIILKNRKKGRSLKFGSAGCSLLGLEASPVAYLGIYKLRFFDQK
jgi:hypothetical protein